MSNSKKYRVWEILFAVFSLGLIGLIVYSFVKNGMSAFVEGWSKLNVIHDNLLFEIGVAAMSEMAIGLLLSIILLICAIAIFAKAKSGKTLMKPVAIFIFITKIIACILFLMKANVYWNSAVIIDNMIFWCAMIAITILDLVVSGLMIFITYDKKIFVPATTLFAIVLIAIMGAEIVNTHLYRFFEVPLLPDMTIWQRAELLNEGNANMACYINLCIAFMGVWLARYSANIVIEEHVIRRTVVGQSENHIEDTVVVPKKIIVDNAMPELLPEIDTDDDMKIDLEEVEDVPALEEELEAEEVPVVEIVPDVEEVAEEAAVEEAAVEEAAIEEEPKIEELAQMQESEAEVTDIKITAQDAASELINLTMRLQKKEISEEEYNQMKKDLFDKL